jgi:hypothetical protein
MVDEHEAARTTLAAFIQQQQQQLTPEISDVDDVVRLKGLRIVSLIASADEGQVDRVYIDTQVQAHTEADGVLENLINIADSDALRAQLEQLRSSVQTHLADARALQDGLSGSSD